MKPMTYRQLVKLLKAHGCEKVHQVGSHEKWKAPGGCTTSVPKDREIAPGTLPRRGMAEMSYKAIATRDEAGWWTVTVPDVPGAFTQAKRLELLPSRVAEAIATMEERPTADDIEVELVARLPEEIEAQIDQARRLRTDADAAMAAAGGASRRAARTLVRDLALTVRDAGTLLGLSPQRVAQLLKS